MSDVLHWINRQKVEEVRRILEEAGDQGALDAAEAVWANEPRARSSIYTTAETVLEVFGDPRVAAMTEISEIDASWLLNGDCNTLYLIAPGDDQEDLAAIFNAIVYEMIGGLERLAAVRGVPLDPGLLVALDECANLTPLPTLDRIASTIAKTGGQLLTVFHDFGQVVDRWGPNKARTIVNNHRAKMFGSGIADVDTLAQLARLIGDEPVMHTSATHGDGRDSTTASIQYRPLAPVDELRQTAFGEAILIYGNLPPVRLRLRLWFKDRALRRLVDGVDGQQPWTARTARTMVEQRRERRASAGAGS